MGRTVLALMLREMATTYGRSAGGYLWAILDPVLGIALLSVLFSLALRHPPRADCNRYDSLRGLHAAA